MKKWLTILETIGLTTKSIKVKYSFCVKFQVVIVLTFYLSINKNTLIKNSFNFYQ